MKSTLSCFWIVLSCTCAAIACACITKHCACALENTGAQKASTCDNFQPWFHLREWFGFQWLFFFLACMDVGNKGSTNDELWRAQSPSCRAANCRNCKAAAWKSHVQICLSRRTYSLAKAQFTRPPQTLPRCWGAVGGWQWGGSFCTGDLLFSTSTDESRPFSCHNSCSHQARLIKYSVPASSSSLSQQWAVTLALENPASVNITMQSLPGSLDVILLSTFSVMTSLCSLLCIKYR